MVLFANNPVSGEAVNTEDFWTTKAPLHEARGGLGVAAVADKIYAIGGSTAIFSHSIKISGGFVGTNEQYNPSTDTWTFKSPMPTARSHFATAVLNGKIFCIGGTADNNYFRVNEVYDPLTDNWTVKSPMPTARAWPQANVVNGKIYVIGGLPNRSTYDVYDPESDSWTTLSGVKIYASTVINEKIVGYTKVDSSDNLGIKYQWKTQIYDTVTGTWSNGVTAPFVQYYSGGATFGAACSTSGMLSSKKIYLFSGGATYNKINTDTSLSKVNYTNQIYDPIDSTWILGANVPTNRIDFGVANINDVFYVIGGTTRTYPIALDDILYDDMPSAVNEQYTPIGYGIPDPSYVPPVESPSIQLSIVSPSNKLHSWSSVSLVYSADTPLNWTGYSLDGKENVTIAGNASLTGLSAGLHNLTVYATDQFGNEGVSETVVFTVTAEPFPTVPLVAASVVAVAVICAAMLICHRKRFHKKEKP